MDFKEQLAADVANVFCNPNEFGENVIVYLSAGRGAAGAVFDGAYHTIAVVSLGLKNITDSRGDEIVSSGSALFRSDCEVRINDEVEYRGKRYKIVRVDWSEGGIEAYFGG